MSCSNLLALAGGATWLVRLHPSSEGPWITVTFQPPKPVQGPANARLRFAVRPIDTLGGPQPDLGKFVGGLQAQMVEKLSRVRPRTLGQASRMAGVTPAAVSLIQCFLEIQARGRTA